MKALMLSTSTVAGSAGRRPSRSMPCEKVAIGWSVPCACAIADTSGCRRNRPSRKLPQRLERATNSHWPVDLQTISDGRQQPSDGRQQTSDRRKQPSDRRKQTSDRQLIMPAPAVTPVASSIRMNEPVVRFFTYGSTNSGLVVRIRIRPISLRPSSPVSRSRCREFTSSRY
jgi:hypothetical protein